MQNSFTKTLLASIAVSLPTAYLLLVLNYAVFQHLSVVDAFNAVSRLTTFGQGYIYNLTIILTALLFLAALLGGKSKTKVSSRAVDGHASDTSHDSNDTYEADGDRETGTVKWFNVSKGFGFISRSNGEDVFVHYRSIRGEGHRKLMEGQQVEFAVSEGEKGLQADDVIPAAK